MKPERRSGNIEVRVLTRATYRGVELPKQFTAMPLIYEVVDDYGTIWNPGVFNDARLPVLSFGHSGWDYLDMILGKALDYTDRAQGPEYLYEFADFDVIDSAARAASLLDGQVLREFSVGFERREWEGGPSGDGQVAPLRDTDRELGAYERMMGADHLETSIVIAGAVPGTKVLALRSKRGVRHVPENLVIDLAKKVAGGELTQDEAKIALDLAADDLGEGAGEGVGSGDGTEGSGGPAEPDPTSVATSAEADEALATLGLD